MCPPWWLPDWPTCRSRPASFHRVKSVPRYCRRRCRLVSRVQHQRTTDQSVNGVKDTAEASSATRIASFVRLTHLQPVPVGIQEGLLNRDCPTRCPQWCLHGGWRQAGLSAHQPRPICQVWHRWPLTADWASEVLVQIHRHTSVLAALLPRRPWAVRQDRSASVRHSPASTSVFHSAQYLAHCCSAYTVVKWLTSSHSMASSTTSTLTTLSCICRYELTTPLRGSKFLPHVPLTSNSGTCRTACSSTPTSQRCWLSGRQLCRQYLLWLDYCNAVLYGAPAGSIQ